MFYLAFLGFFHRLFKAKTINFYCFKAEKTLFLKILLKKNNYKRPIFLFRENVLNGTLTSFFIPKKEFTKQILQTFLKN